MIEFFKRIFSSSERALIGKDFGSIWHSKTYRTLLALIPALLMLVFPIVFLVMISTVADGSSEAIMQLIPDAQNNYSYRQALYDVFINMLCPMLYILVPILCASFSAVAVFTQEKEDQTTGTLILSSISVKSIVKCKLAVAFLNSTMISLISIVIMTVVMSLGNIILNVKFFFNGEWAILFFLMTPGMIGLSVLVSYFIFVKTKYSIDGIVASAYTALPFVLMYIGQFTGLYHISWGFLLVFALLVIIADFLLYRFIIERVTADKLIGA